MKTFKFSLVLRTRENTDVFITFDENIYGIHSKRVNILYIFPLESPRIIAVSVYYTKLIRTQTMFSCNSSLSFVSYGVFHYENTPIQMYWEFYHQKMKTYR